MTDDVTRHRARRSSFGNASNALSENSRFRISAEHGERLLRIVPVPVRVVAGEHQRVLAVHPVHDGVDRLGWAGSSTGWVAKRTRSRTYSLGRRFTQGVW